MYLFKLLKFFCSNFYSKIGKSLKIVLLKKLNEKLKENE